MKTIKWSSAAPGAKPKELTKIDDQHLCNILWFNEILNGWNRHNSEIQFLLGLEWYKRCNQKAGRELLDGEIKRLPWKPLPVLTEIQDLKRLGMIHVSGKILRNKVAFGIYSGNKADYEVIGSIAHIENWENI